MNNRDTIHGLVFALIATAAVVCNNSVFADDPPKLSAEHLEFFETKIRPIFVQHCYECHSSKSGDDLEGGLLLDSREGWKSGGDSGPAIVPGKVDESLVVQAIRYDEDLVSAMPPKSKLPDDAIKLIEKWVEMGAPDPRESTGAKPQSMVEAFDIQKRFHEHWSWRPIGNPDVPDVRNSEWPRNKIDHFVLARLEEVGLLPAKEADKEIWIRRVYFDLIGLPPTPAQVDAFLADTSEKAHETVVDELLKSKHFGEKWARHWMDLVRYAETYGHEFDYPLDFAHEYRDYLIRAFNADVPYDQFLREHVAGDLIPNPRRHPTEQFNESIIGTGFWYFHEATHAPTDVLMNEADICDNQIDVFGKAFLGLTVACARCHDHKFDAISTADYYALTAYIQSSCRQLYPLDSGRKIESSVNKLNQLRAKYADAWRNRDKVDLASLSPAKYFAATKVAFEKAKDSPQKRMPEVVFEDFEGDFSRWTIDGDAFGKRPQRGAIKPQKDIPNLVGSAFAGSFNGRDQLTGTLTSKPFKITHAYIKMKIGGGRRNCFVEVSVDGKPLERLFGDNSETLRDKSWNVRRHIGKQAVIKIVDNHKGGWGHINVDQIVFADHAAENSPSGFRRPSTELIESIAADFRIDASKLEEWVNRAFSAKANPRSNDPFYLIAVQLKSESGTKQIADHQKSLAKNAADYQQANDLFVDFSGNQLPDGWTTSGHAFQSVGVNAENPFVPVHGVFPAIGSVDSAVYGKRASGVLRSPTFKLTKKNIHVRMRGTANARMRVIIDNYQMAKFNALLFRGTDVSGETTNTHGKWEWRTIGGDLRKYVGHKAYLEIIDTRDDSIAIDQIWLSDGGPPSTSSRVLATAFANGEQSLNEAWKSTCDQIEKGERTPLLNWLTENDLLADSNFGVDSKSILSEANQVADALPHPRYVVAMADGTVESANVYVRGNPAMLGKEVPGRDLEALGGAVGNRLDLANRMASSQNPLTSRVMVNRIWHHLFGRGIVPSVDDFGPQGQSPSHPELLDALATQFISDGWSTKRMIRQIVLSSTYRQASVANSGNNSDQIATADPTNELLHRMRVRRLPAESIRDAMLAVSGRLDARQFGGSVPTHRTEFMTGRGARGSGPLDGAGRRSIYLSIYRNFLNPFLTTFDMPNPFGPKGRRSNSNVPAQALTLMNDPFVLDQSRLWVKAAASQPDSRKRITNMIRSAHTVTPKEEHVARLVDFVNQHEDAGANQEKAWADLAHALFNMKAFYFLR